MRLTVNGGHLGFQVYRGGGRRELYSLDCSQSSIFASDRQDPRFALRAAIFYECQNVLGSGGDLGGSVKNTAVFLRWIQRAASLESPTLVNLQIERKPFTVQSIIRP